MFSLSFFLQCVKMSIYGGNDLHEIEQYWPYSVKRVFNPLPDDKILDWSKLKQIADDILKCI